MLTTIIYRSHLRDDVPVKALESMVADANIKNNRADVTGSCYSTAPTFSSYLKALKRT